MLGTSKYHTSDAITTLWNTSINFSITNEEMWSLYPEFLKQVKHTKLRYFQYRVLTQTLATNVKQNHRDPQISKNCTFCQNEPELITHLQVRNN